MVTVDNLEATDNPRLIAKAYRRHKEVRDYEADGILCRALEHCADRLVAAKKALKFLEGACVDSNGAPMADGEPPRDIIRCRDIRAVAAALRLATQRHRF